MGRERCESGSERGAVGDGGGFRQGKRDWLALLDVLYEKLRGLREAVDKLSAGGTRAVTSKSSM